MSFVTTPGQNEKTSPGNVNKARGNFGHAGRPGQRGGSAPSDGGEVGPPPGGNSNLGSSSHPVQSVFVGLGGKKNAIGVTYHDDIDLERIKQIADSIGATTWARAPSMNSGGSSFRGVRYVVPNPEIYHTESFVNKPPAR